MATLAQIKRFVEGTDLLGTVQADVKGIEGTSVPDIIADFNDLQLSVAKAAEFQDLFNDPYSISKGFLLTTVQDAGTYLQGIPLQVEQPNNPGHYINLYYGTTGLDGDGDIDSNYNDTTTDDEGYQVPVAANLWEMMTKGSQGTLITDWGDCYYDNGGGAAPGLWTDWSLGGNINLSCNMWDGSGTDNGCYCAAQGSLSQWAQYIHVTPGDASALNRDALMG